MGCASSSGIQSAYVDEADMRRPNATRSRETSQRNLHASIEVSLPKPESPTCSPPPRANTQKPLANLARALELENDPPSSSEILLPQDHRVSLAAPTHATCSRFLHDVLISWKLAAVNAHGSEAVHLSTPCEEELMLEVMSAWRESVAQHADLSRQASTKYVRLLYQISLWQWREATKLIEKRRNTERLPILFGQFKGRESETFASSRSFQSVLDATPTVENVELCYASSYRESTFRQSCAWDSKLHDRRKEVTSKSAKVEEGCVDRLDTIMCTQSCTQGAPKPKVEASTSAVYQNAIPPSQERAPCCQRLPNIPTFSDLPPQHFRSLSLDLSSDCRTTGIEVPSSAPCLVGGASRDQAVSGKCTADDSRICEQLRSPFPDAWMHNKLRQRQRHNIMIDDIPISSKAAKKARKQLPPLPPFLNSTMNAVAVAAAVAATTAVTA